MLESSSVGNTSLHTSSPTNRPPAAIPRRLASTQPSLQKKQSISSSTSSSYPNKRLKLSKASPEASTTANQYKTKPLKQPLTSLSNQAVNVCHPISSTGGDNVQSSRKSSTPQNDNALLAPSSKLRPLAYCTSAAGALETAEDTLQSPHHHVARSSISGSTDGCTPANVNSTAAHHGVLFIHSSSIDRSQSWVDHNRDRPLPYGHDGRQSSQSLTPDIAASASNRGMQSDCDVCCTDEIRKSLRHRQGSHLLQTKTNSSHLSNRHVKFARGPLETADGHPDHEGRQGAPRCANPAPQQVMAQINLKQVAALEEELGPDNLPSLLRLKRRIGLLPPLKRTRQHATPQPQFPKNPAASSLGPDSSKDLADTSESPQSAAPSAGNSCLRSSTLVRMVFFKSVSRDGTRAHHQFLYSSSNSAKTTFVLR